MTANPLAAMMAYPRWILWRAEPDPDKPGKFKKKPLSPFTGIVTDRDSLIAQINKETLMDMEQLAKAHPELLAQIKAEAASAAGAEAQASIAAAQENFLAVTRMVAGDESADRISALLAANLSAEQVAAFSTAFGGLAPAPAAAASSEEASAAQDKQGRREILDALRAGTPAPVNTSTTVADADPVYAAIDRISKINA